MTVAPGSTDQSVYVHLADSSDGTDETGFTHADLTVNYQRDNGSLTSVTLNGTHTNLNDAHSDGYVKHASGGTYRIDAPDAAFASGASVLRVYVSATGAVQTRGAEVIQLKDVADAGDEMDLIDAPNATAVATIQAGLATAASVQAIAVILGTPVEFDSGANLADNLVDIYNRDAEIHNALQDVTPDVIEGVWAYSDRVLTAGTNIVLAKGTGITGFNDIAATAIVSGGAINTSSGAVTTVTNLTNAPTAGDLTATMKASVTAAATAATPVAASVTGSVGSISGVSFPSNFALLGINGSGHVSRVTLVDTTTTNTDMRGTDGAYTGTPPTAAAIRGEIDSNSTQLAAILVDTGTALPAAIAGVSGLDAAGVRAAIGMAAANLDSQLAAISPGESETIYTLYITSADGRRAAGAAVTITADSAGTEAIACGTADSTGKVVTPLPDGTHYIWARHAQFTFTNPTQITVPEE